MRRTTKLLAAFLILITMLLTILPLTAFAADEGTTLYFVPGSDWSTDNARFAAYVWIEGADHIWIEMADEDGDGVYEFVVPAGYNNIIFVRLNPKETHTGWSTKWNQTIDYTIPDNGDNLFTITNPWKCSASSEKGDGKWSKYDSSICVHTYGDDKKCTKCGEELSYIIAGYVYKDKGTDTYADGDNTTLFGSKWDETDENNRMEYDPTAGCYVKIYENVAKGKYAFKVVENKSWDVNYGWDGENCIIEVEEDGSMVVITFKSGTITCAADRPIIPADPEDTTDSTDKTPENKPDNGSTEQGKDNLNGDNEESPVKLNFFQKIWKAILDFFRKLFGIKE